MKMIKCTGSYLGLVTALMLLISTPSRAETMLEGLFITYHSSSHYRAMHEEKSLTSILNEGYCTLHRQGKIENSQGNLDLEKPNRYLFYACKKSDILNTELQQVFNVALSLYGNIKAVSGKLTPSDEMALNVSGKGRSYIIKISHYNNRNPMTRQSDLALISTKIKGNTLKYYNEASIRVDVAFGMARPDEVSVIYYDTPEAGQAFREQRSDVLNAVGAYNKDHLTEFTYLVGSSAL